MLPGLPPTRFGVRLAGVAACCKTKAPPPPPPPGPWQAEAHMVLKILPPLPPETLTLRFELKF